MILKNESYYWNNNENTTMQKDQYGSVQNIAYYDADDGMQVGPNDPKFSIITQVPINMFRPQPFSDFDEVSLDNKWSYSGTGSSYLSYANSCVTLNTGTTNGSVGEIMMPNVPIYFVNGQRVYFYLSTTPNGNLEAEFGIKYDDNNLIRFKRVEDNTAVAYYSETRASGVSNTYSDVAPANSVRRLFCIEMVSDVVKFWVGTDMGILQLKATHTANIPIGIGHAYVKFKNRYAANRELAVDFVWPVRIR